VWSVYVIVVLLLGALPGAADDRRSDPSRLTLMTLNVRFLWDGVEPEEGIVGSFPWKGHPELAKAHMGAVAELIRRCNPDIVHLAEVENLAALTLFNDRHLSDLGYRPYLINGRDWITGQDVGLLTRIDPDGNTVFRSDLEGQAGDERKGVSKNLFATFTLPEGRFALIGIHLLAEPYNRSRLLEREAQADAVRRTALMLQRAGYPLVVLGDFNDFDGSRDGRDHIGSLPITRVLAMIRGMDPFHPLDDLVNAADWLPRRRRFTAFFDLNRNGCADFGELAGVDHILLSPQLWSRVEKVDIPQEHNPLLVTDHFPVVVRLRLGADPIPPSPDPQPVVVRITSLLPHPEEDQRQNEEATIKNLGAEPVNLLGWKLRDRANTTWCLDGEAVLKPGEERVIRRNGQWMGMNDTGDTIELVDAAGQVLHLVTYGEAERGRRVFTDN